MTNQPKKKLDEYEMDVESQNYIPNKENPKRIEITVSFEYDGETYEVTPPPFSPSQVAKGSWEKHACRYIDKRIEDIEGKTQHEIPNLEGETIKNSGYDFTGPQDKERYPEGPDT